MENREKYKRLLGLLASGVILAVQTGIFVFVWFTSYADNGSNYFVRGNYVVIAQYALMIFCFYKIYGGFKIGYLRIFDVLYSQILSILCVNVITYLQLSLIGRWKFMTNLEPIILMTLVDMLAVVVWVLFTRWIYGKLYPPRKMLLVYGKYSPENLVRKMSSRDDKYVIEERISAECDPEEIKRKISEYRSVVLTDIPAELRNKLLKYCFEHDIRCYCVPKISDIMILGSDLIHLFDTPLLVFKNMGLTAEQRFMKRAFDIVVSAILIVLTLPVMAVIAVFIKAYDKGPVIFTQERLTENGRIFKVYKFRSMRVEPAEQEYCLTRKNDDRITPVGRILRNIHFDELPQLYNIFKGDMSFVGPRPECPKLAEDYCRIIPEFSYRLKVKAGLTGFAQVYGKYNTTPYDKLKLDMTYIENYSLLLDLKLMMLTFKILFQKENTEGIESWQTTAATREDMEKIRKENES